MSLSIPRLGNHMLYYTPETLHAKTLHATCACLSLIPNMLMPYTPEKFHTPAGFNPNILLPYAYYTHLERYMRVPLQAMHGCDAFSLTEVPSVISAMLGASS